MKCGEHWRRALNSSKILHGITDLRKLSHMEETIFYVTSELSWHWTDTVFSGVRLLEVTVQRLSFMIFLPYCWLMFFQVSAAPLCPFVYTHTGFFLPQTKSHHWYLPWWDWYSVSLLPCRFCLYPVWWIMGLYLVVGFWRTVNSWYESCDLS